MKLEKSLIRIICFLLIMSFSSSQVHAIEYLTDTLAASLASDSGLGSDRSKTVQAEIAETTLPGAIGNGAPLIALLKGSGREGLPPKLSLDPDRFTELQFRIRKAINLAQCKHAHEKDKIKFTTNDLKKAEYLETIAETTSYNLVAFNARLSKELYPFLAIRNGVKDYLIGFDLGGRQIEEKRALAIDFIDWLFAKYHNNPEIAFLRLAQYIYHECTPEKTVIKDEAIDRSEHKEIYTKIQAAIFGKKEVNGLKADLREFINEKAAPACLDPNKGPADTGRSMVTNMAQNVSTPRRVAKSATYYFEGLKPNEQAYISRIAMRYGGTDIARELLAKARCGKITSAGITRSGLESDMGLADALVRSAQDILMMAEPDFGAGNRWVDNLLRRNTEKTHIKVRAMFEHFLAPDHKIKTEIFDPIDSLSDDEKIEQATKALTEIFGDTFTGTPDITLKQAFLRMTRGGQSLSQVFVNIDFVEDVSRFEGKPEDRVAPVKRIVRGYYLMIRGLEALSRKSDLTLIDKEDVDNMLAYHKDRYEETDDILSLADLILPADTTEKSESLKNLLVLIERLSDASSLWKDGFDRAECRQKIDLIRRTVVSQYREADTLLKDPVSAKTGTRDRTNSEDLNGSIDATTKNAYQNISDDLPVRAEIFKVTLMNMLDTRKDQLFFIGVETYPGDTENGNVMPMIQEIVDGIRGMKDVHGKPVFANLMVKRGSASELTKTVNDLADTSKRESLLAEYGLKKEDYEKLKFSKDNAFIGARYTSEKSGVYDSIKFTGQDGAWISTVDDSKDGSYYIPAFESVTLSMLAYIKADYEFIEKFYNSISENKLDSAQWNDMTAKRVFYLLPKMGILAAQLPELYRLACVAYMAA